MSYPCKITYIDQNNKFDQKVYSRVFSFSLFMPNNIYQLYNEAYNNFNSDNNILQSPKYKPVKEWFNKYCKQQVNMFNYICKEWADFSIIHFVSEIFDSLPSIKENNDGSLSFNDTLSLARALINFSIKENYPYRLYTYYCQDFDPVDPFYGTVVRFIPLLFKNIEIVLFRDAHSTIPENNGYDLEWKDTWIKDSKKRFWMYTAPWYNPEHASGEHVPFAATWGARNLNYDPVKQSSSCFTDQEWNNTFGKLHKYDSTYFESKPGYGVDERLFNYVIKNFEDINNKSSFEHNTYFIGITWLGYLFYNPPDPNDFIRYDINDLAKNRLNHPLSGNKTVFLKTSSHIDSIRTYYSEIKCNLLDLLTPLSDVLSKNKKDITVDEYFDYIDNIQRTYISSKNPELKYIERLPSRYHIWEYLFHGHNIKDKKLLEYIQEFGKNVLNDSTKLEKICDNNKYMFIGDAFNPSVNIYEDRELNTIVLPKKHPLNQSYL